MNLELVEVTVRYRRKTVCQNVTISVSPGVVVVLGANGAGKTTLLHAIANPALLHSGEIRFGDGVFPGRGSEQRAYFVQSGYLPQHWTFFPKFTAFETVQYAAWLKAIPKLERFAAAERALEQC